MRRAYWERVGLILGPSLAFGSWHWSFPAGAFMFCLLLFVDVTVNELMGWWR